MLKTQKDSKVSLIEAYHDTMIGLQTKVREGKTKVETNLDVFERSAQLTKYLRHFMDANSFKDDEKICLVTHSNIICALTGRGVDIKDAFEGGYRAENAQIVPWDLK